MNKSPLLIARRRAPLIPLETALGGWFKLEAIRPDGRRRLLADWFPNLITNAGLEAIGNAGGYLGECRVGSGNTTPNVADTALVAQIATSTTLHDSDLSAQPSAPYYGAVTNVYRFAAGDAAGNLAEVGIGATSGADLFSRALILDGGGSPTTITVLADEVLDVTYQLRLYPPTVDVTGTIDISGDSYDFTARAADVTGAGRWAPTSTGEVGGLYGSNLTVYDGAIGAVTGLPTGTSDASNSIVNAAYSAGTHRIDGTATFGLDTANFDILSALVVFGQSVARFGAVQIEFDPVIPKDDTKVLTLTFRHSWARKTLP